MIGVGMGDKEIMDIPEGDVHLFQLMEDPIAAAGIHQQHVVLVTDDKTRVVAFRYRRMSRT